MGILVVVGSDVHWRAGEVLAPRHALPGSLPQSPALVLSAVALALTGLRARGGAGAVR